MRERLSTMSSTVMLDGAMSISFSSNGNVHCETEPQPMTRIRPGISIHPPPSKRRGTLLGQLGALLPRRRRQDRQRARMRTEVDRGRQGHAVTVDTDGHDDPERGLGRREAADRV